MKCIASMFLALTLMLVPVAALSQAPPFPDVSRGKPAQRAGKSEPRQPQRYYGYVPPPPIQHTWPGGYRAIIDELTNTLIKHIKGQY